MREWGKSWNESACAALVESGEKGRWLTWRALLVPPLAMRTCLVEGLRIGRQAETRSGLAEVVAVGPRVKGDLGGGGV
jgi:hypothetical protein